MRSRKDTTIKQTPFYYFPNFVNKCLLNLRWLVLDSLISERNNNFVINFILVGVVSLFIEDMCLKAGNIYNVENLRPILLNVDTFVHCSHSVSI